MRSLVHCRAEFPALARLHEGEPCIYFDGPAGSQVPLCVAEAVQKALLHANANTHGCFATSRESDQLLKEAHQAAATFVNAEDPDCVIFGPNMTTLTFALSRALARTWRSGDEVMVTQMDHDANVTPWVLATRDAGITVRTVRLRPEDCTLDVEDFRAKLNIKTRLVAFGCASNAVGTINPITDLVRMAKDAGALTFLDAVHYAPHLLPDVAAWGCDFMACSAYKFFGPHVGILWGKRALLEKLEAYKVRPASNNLPDKWMTGTQNHEGIAGTLAAIDYVASLGAPSDKSSRREALVSAYLAIRNHERQLSRQFVTRLRELPAFKLWGITDQERFDHRVATFAITHARLKAAELATQLGQRGIFTWHGNYYALNLTEALGLEPHGMLRIGFLHYNTVEEVDRLVAALGEIDAKSR